MENEKRNRKRKRRQGKVAVTSNVLDFPNIQLDGPKDVHQVLGSKSLALKMTARGYAKKLTRLQDVC